MKHHKVKDVWKHKPDALPLPDAPSTGAKRKKGPLEKASKKHLWDLLHQSRKDLLLKVRWLDFGWASTDASTCSQIVRDAGKMEEIILELERRME